MTDYLVRGSALQGIRTTVEELGGDADTLFRRTGLTEAEQAPDSWFSYRSYLLLLEEAARSTNCQHFGLRLSQQQDIGILGALGFVIQQAPDLRTALRELSTHFVHHNQGATVSLSVDDGIAYWRFTSKLGGYAPMWQQSDLVAGIGIDLMRLLREISRNSNIGSCQDLYCCINPANKIVGFNDTVIRVLHAYSVCITFNRIIC